MDTTRSDKVELDDCPSESAPSPLPYDILVLIISSLFQLPPIPRTRTLLSLSLVSHSISSIAQPFLYNSPYISFDPPDDTPPGTTYSRILGFVTTLSSRQDLRDKVRDLCGLGGWGKRCLSEGVPDRRVVSQIMLRLIGLCERVEKLDVPFVVESDKGRLMTIFTDNERWNEVREVRFGNGYQVRDPWVVNVDQGVMDQWGQAKWYISDFGQLSRKNWTRVNRFELNARLRVRDPPDEEDEEEKLGFELESFELNLSKNEKLSFLYLSRFLSSSLSTLTSLTLKEHQLQLPPTQFELLLRTYGSKLESLETTSSNQFDDNLPLIHCISASCPSLTSLSIGSRVNHLLPTLQLLSFLPSLETLVLKSVHSLELDKGRLEDCLFGFPKLKRFVCEPSHANVEDGLRQDREVAEEFRKLEGREKEGRRCRTEVGFWRWRVEIEEE